jgi:hypothetical protein
MLTYILIWIVALGSLGIYLTKFLVPEVHRENDIIWSGVGLFYALVLLVYAGRIRGGLLLGETAGVALLVWFGWQTFQLRRGLVPSEQQTPLPDISVVKEKVQSLTVTLQSKLGNLPGKQAQSPTQASPTTGTPAGSKPSIPVDVSKLKGQAQELLGKVDTAKIQQQAQGAFAKIKDQAQSRLGGLKQQLPNRAPKAPTVPKVAKPSTPAAPAVVEPTTPMGVVDAVVEAVNPDAVKEAVASTAETVSSAAETATEAAEAAVEKIVESAEAAIETVVETAESVTETVVEVASEAVEAVTPEPSAPEPAPESLPEAVIEQPEAPPVVAVVEEVIEVVEVVPVEVPVSEEAIATESPPQEHISDSAEPAVAPEAHAATDEPAAVDEPHPDSPVDPPHSED